MLPGLLMSEACLDLQSLPRGWGGTALVVAENSVQVIALGTGDRSFSVYLASAGPTSPVSRVNSPSSPTPFLFPWGPSYTSQIELTAAQVSWCLTLNPFFVVLLIKPGALHLLGRLFAT
jgi:hypothetical protein